MYIPYLLVSAAALVASLPYDNAAAGLRLIKTSEEDPGTWVTEQAKISEYTAKGIHFVDITDIKDKEVLTRLSTKPGNHSPSTIKKAAVDYPSVLSHETEAKALIEGVSTSGPESWLKTMTEFFNRYYEGEHAGPSAQWMFDTVKSVSESNSAIEVTQFEHAFDQPSVIARIPGNSSSLVIVGAHYDSTGGDATARGPGADDNGSGVVVILEALRVLAENNYRPKNTLEFHFYGGEEGGLLGSQAIFSEYKSSSKNVLAFLNQDMAGYSPSGKISVYDDYSDPALVEYVKKNVNAYGGGSFTTDSCGYACSDHASAFNNGFPGSYVCDEPMDTATPHIHSPNDTYETIEWPTVLRHSQFTVGFLVEASYI